MSKMPAPHNFPVIDSHIHLYLSSHLPRLSWAAKLHDDHVLHRQNSVREYRSATRSLSNLQGFIFVETDRTSGLGEIEWDDVLAEVGFVLRYAGKDGLEPEDRKLVLGAVPWAPIPAGPAVVSRYLSRVKEQCGDDSTWSQVRGVRYLLQDKPSGVMLQPDFVESLKWLGKNNLTFDLGVDARSGGLLQLREACEMLARVHDGGSDLHVIINHFCKPNLQISAPEASGGHPEFAEWRECITRMAEYPGTYMKLSGFFSELPPQSGGNVAPVEELLMHIKPWLDVVFASFGPSRIMYGSDWPVCNVGGSSIEDSWSHWTRLVTAILEAQHLTESEKAMIWSGTAIDAYNIK